MADVIEKKECEHLHIIENGRERKILFRTDLGCKDCGNWLDVILASKDATIAELRKERDGWFESSRAWENSAKHKEEQLSEKNKELEQLRKERDEAMLKLNELCQKECLDCRQFCMKKDESGIWRCPYCERASEITALEKERDGLAKQIINLQEADGEFIAMKDSEIKNLERERDELKAKLDRIGVKIVECIKEAEKERDAILAVISKIEKHRLLVCVCGHALGWHNSEGECEYPEGCTCKTYKFSFDLIETVRVALKTAIGDAC